MEFILEPSNFFLKQLANLDRKSSKILVKKLQMLKASPSRNKKLKHQLNLFRIRFKENGKEKRLIYRVDKNRVKIICILDREKDYKDLDKLITKALRQS